MKTKDFEQAIEDLCVQGLEIDEVKMKVDSGGHVHQVNGHTGTLNVVWDELGRAFTALKDQEIEGFIELGSGKAIRGKRLKRDAKFDLKFECRICGCTENDPCFHPDWGMFWWVDDTLELCSHCADPEIANDPETTHCVNSNGMPSDCADLAEECWNCANMEREENVCMLSGKCNFEQRE